MIPVQIIRSEQHRILIFAPAVSQLSTIYLFSQHLILFTPPYIERSENHMTIQGFLLKIEVQLLNFLFL